jgi:hypothetical protein
MQLEQEAHSSSLCVSVLLRRSRSECFFIIFQLCGPSTRGVRACAWVGAVRLELAL